MIQMGFTHSASRPRKCKSWLSAWVLVMYPVNHVTTRFGASDSLRISLRTTDDTGTDERIGSKTYHIAESPMIQAFSNTLELVREDPWRLDIQTRTPLCGRPIARSTAKFQA